MAAIARDSSRFAGVKAFSEKFSQPEVDADGRIRKVGIASEFKRIDITSCSVKPYLFSS